MENREAEYNLQALDLSPEQVTQKCCNKNMKEEESSKCLYIRSTANMPLKWKDLRNADILKLSEIACIQGFLNNAQVYKDWSIFIFYCDHMNQTDFRNVSEWLKDKQIDGKILVFKAENT